MKTKTLILLTVLALATVVRAQISYVDTTTLHTNTQTGSGTITIPGVVTNAPFTTINTNFYSIGDSPATAWGKANGDFFYLYTWTTTNEFGIYELTLTNTGGSYISMDGSTLILNTNGMGGGSGGGSSTNAILKSFGVGNDTTITNSFTLVNTNIVNYTFQSATVSGYTVPCTNTPLILTNYFTSVVTATTNCGITNPVNSIYVYDGEIGALTNVYGLVLTLEDPTGNGTINGDPNQPVNIANFDPSTNYVVSILVSPDNNCGAGTWHYISRNNYTNGDYGQHSYANYVPASSNWVFHSDSPLCTYPFYTTNTPAVPVNGSAYQIYTNGAAYDNEYDPILATFNVTNRVPGVFIPNFTNVFTTIPTNPMYVIWQVNNTNSFSVLTYSTNSDLNFLNGQTRCNGQGVCNAPTYISTASQQGCHHDITKGITFPLPSDICWTIVGVPAGTTNNAGCTCGLPPVFSGFYPIYP